MNESNQHPRFSESPSPENSDPEKVVNRSRRAFLGFCGAAAATSALAFVGYKDEGEKTWEKQHKNDYRDCVDEWDHYLEDSEKDDPQVIAEVHTKCSYADSRDIRNLYDLGKPKRLWSVVKKGVPESNHSLVSYFRTAIESVAKHFVSIGAGQLIEKYDERKYDAAYYDTGSHTFKVDAPYYEDFRIKTGNRSMIGIEEKLSRIIKNPTLRKAIMLWAPIIGAPIAEEIIFRQIPQEMFVASTNEGYAWNVGFPAAVAFGLFHNLREDDDRDGINFKFEYSVPIQQTIGGLYYWYALRRPGGGLTHAILGHAIHNSMCGVRGRFQDRRWVAANKDNINAHDPSPR